jgi:hypothetical protein
VKTCAAQEGFRLAGEKSRKCGDEYNEPSDECLIEEGLWKGHLSTQLEMKSFDLNSDNMPDYIVTGVSCTGMTGNAANEYFVFLSQKDKSYDLAVSITAQYISVLPKANGGGYLLLEGASQLSGESARIWSLEGNQYSRTACFYKDKVNEKEPEFRKCREQ